MQSYEKLFGLLRSIWKEKRWRARAASCLGDGAFAAVLAAVPGRIPMVGRYPLFLLCGLAPWFYVKEILEESPRLRKAYHVPLRDGRMGLASLAALKALAALPTLLLWLGVLTLAALFHGADVGPLLRVQGYVIFCSLLNGMAQSLLSFALAPILPMPGAQGGMAGILPLLFWAAPLAWPLSALSAAAQRCAMLHPLVYIAEALRATVGEGFAMGGAAGADMAQEGLWAALFFAAVCATGALGYALQKRAWGLPFPAEGQAPAMRRGRRPPGKVECRGVSRARASAHPPPQN